MERRTFLRFSVVGASTAAFTGSLWGQAFATPAQKGPSPYGSLLAADANGIRLPNGFTSRVIARSRQIVSGTSYSWHDAPDGGACFADGSGWIYVSNSEISGTGGASEIHFNSSGTVTSASRILSNTNRNCAGGATPWNTWLSCKEVDTGYVWETYPFGGTAVRRDAIGRFNHEAAAADPVRQVIYLTEDKSDGCLYRFRPTSWGTLSWGTLEVLKAGTATPGSFTWGVVPDPDGSPTATRNQVSGAKRFNGGEGCHYVAPFLRITGQSSSEITGTSGSSSGGITYEVRGPFR